MRLRFLCILSLALTPFAWAGTITVTFTGTIGITQVPGISAGDAFTGEFVYTTPSPVAINVNPNEVIYYMNQPGDEILVNVDNYWFLSQASNAMSLTTDHNFFGGSTFQDLMEVVGTLDGGEGLLSTNYPTTSSFIFDQIGASIVGNTNLLNNSTNPPDPFNEADVRLGPVDASLTEISIYMEDSSSNLFVFTGVINGVDTPEPAAALMLGMAIAPLCALLLRRKQPY